MCDNLLMAGEEIDSALKRITHQLLEQHEDIDKLAIVGIQRRGVSLAKKIVKYINEFAGKEVPFGILDITLYRDDLSLLSKHPIINDTDVSFVVDNMNIVLVDDVIFTGRTTHAAIDALFSLGRADSIELAVLVDRGHRQIPIKPNYVGKNVPSSLDRRVEVSVPEFDNDYCVRMV